MQVDAPSFSSPRIKISTVFEHACIPLHKIVRPRTSWSHRRRASARIGFIASLEESIENCHANVLKVPTLASILAASIACEIRVVTDAMRAKQR